MMIGKQGQKNETLSRAGCFVFLQLLGGSSGEYPHRGHVFIRFSSWILLRENHELMEF